MPLAFPPEHPSPPLAALLADLGIAPGTLDLAIDARDEMLGFLVAAAQGDREQALLGYFRSGASIADALGQVLRWRFGAAGPGKVLDFASGYGRVTRFLAREVPPERLWVADVYADGVRFQQERLGVHGLVSAIRPEDFACGERFDAILVTSLFTHLPEERFVAWLRTLLGLLAPGGLLAFSAHSFALLPGGEAPPAAGIRFEETSESGSLAKSDYGSTWVTEAFVRSALDRAAGPGASLHRLERALCNFQDLYLAAPEPAADFSSLAFHAEAQLFLERAVLAEEGRRLDLGGWVAVRSGELRAVEARLDGEPPVVVPASALDDRPDVAAFLGRDLDLPCGWSLSLPLPEGVSRTAAVVRLGVRDGRGVFQPLGAGAIETALLVGAHQEAEKLGHELRHARAAHAEEQARAAAEIAGLRARLHAMEASRFWQLRNAWFAVKRALGWTEER